MKPYYEDDWVTQYCADAREVLPRLADNSVDLLATDPPYGIGFMGKDWDKALPDKNIWKECFRVLKPGALAFVMSIPRSDCLSRMIISLEDAGFRVDFTPIFWTYASGFPKAQNIGKSVDKRLGSKREVVGSRVSAYGTNPVGDEVKSRSDGKGGTGLWQGSEAKEVPLTGEPATSQSKALDGSYGGFQPKPAVEVIIVAMKPLSEKTFVDQALKNGKGISWLDDCRIPYESEKDREQTKVGFNSSMPVKDGWHDHDEGYSPSKGQNMEQSGRFPANLLVSDDVLNDGRDTAGSGGNKIRGTEAFYNGSGIGGNRCEPIPDSGSFSRYFDLDKWAQKTMPFLIVPKASKGEKNQSLDMPSTELGHNRFDTCETCGGYLLQNPDRPSACKCEKPIRKHNKIKGNFHPTVKPSN